MLKSQTHGKHNTCRVVVATEALFVGAWGALRKRPPVDVATYSILAELTFTLEPLPILSVILSNIETDRSMHSIVQLNLVSTQPEIVLE